MYCMLLSGTGIQMYGTFGGMFLTPKDLENIRMNDLIIMIASTRLGIIP